MQTEVDYLKSLPKKRMAAGALIAHQGRYLIVQPTYKDAWEIPGGVIEQDESPRQSLRRELREELGIEPSIGDLLIVDYQHPEGSMTESIQFIFNVTLSDDDLARIELPPDELRAFAFAAVEEACAKLDARIDKRFRQAVEASRIDQTFYLENSRRLY